jgi:ATP-dependent Clp protease ATP-binding subunit ClpA
MLVFASDLVIFETTPDKPRLSDLRNMAFYNFRLAYSSGTGTGLSLYQSVQVRQAGERGANLIEIEDFLYGLVLEDQGMLGENVFSKLHDGLGTVRNKAPSHFQFFSQEVAKTLVTRIETLLPQSKPVDLSTEIPLSPALERTFRSAKDSQAQFHHSQIEPLHLLAAILTEESSQGVRLLQEFEITQEKVLEQLKGATED